MFYLFLSMRSTKNCIFCFIPNQTNLWVWKSKAIIHISKESPFSLRFFFSIELCLTNKFSYFLVAYTFHSKSKCVFRDVSQGLSFCVRFNEKPLEFLNIHLAWVYLRLTPGDFVHHSSNETNLVTRATFNPSRDDTSTVPTQFPKKYWTSRKNEIKNKQKAICL